MCSSIKRSGLVLPVLAVVGVWQFASADVEAQRALALPQATRPSSPDLQTLLNRIERLEKRVNDLEKGALTFENKVEDDAKDAQLEARLAALEKARAGDNASGGRAPSSTGGVSRVQAPFEVVASDGRRIARISDDQDGGLHLYNRAGAAVVEIGPNSNAADNGRVSVFASRGKRGTTLYSSSNGGGVLFLTSAGGGPAMVLNGDELEFNILNPSGNPVVTMLAGTSGSGRIEVADAAGKNMIQAGVTTDGVGLVRAGPAGCRTVGALAQPCRIIGTK